MDSIISAIVKALEAAVKYAPGLFAELQKLFSGPPPTEADWQALHERVASKKYQDYDKNYDRDVSTGRT